jgi:Flp pilus assembly protein TadG
MTKNIHCRIGDFLRNTSAMAAVEFALILPVMLLLYIGTAEGSRLFIMDRKIAVVAGTIGDLVARSNDEISGSTLNDYFAAAEFTMLPYDSANLTQRVSSLYIDHNGVGTIIWSRGYNGATARSVGSTIDIPREMSRRFRRTHLIAGEASIRWNPMVDFVYTSGMDLDKIYFYRPRYDEEIVLN